MLTIRALNQELLVTGLSEAPKEVRVPDFTPEPWFQDGWCWAAVATQVHRCLTLEDRPQCHWAERLVSPTCCQKPRDCRAGKPVKEVLDLEGHCRDVRLGPLDFVDIQREIPEVVPEQGKRLPVVCGQSGHVVVLCAWGVDPVDGEYVWYADPAKQELQWSLYTVFRDIKGGGWMATFLEVVS